MYLFCTDLDNTIIYSYKHDIGNDKRNVEIYQDREISFITKKTYELLVNLREKVMIVPTSTRTIEQYNRIDLGIGNFKYSLVCNGGILLIDNKSDNNWYQESLRLIENSNDELQKSINYLDRDYRRIFDLRFIENLFVFTKCNEPEDVVSDLKEYLDNTIVDVFNNGTKVYVVPKSLNKGNAIKRLNDIIKADKIISAGDSEFDISMLEISDYGLCPHGFKEKFSVCNDLIEAPKDTIFSDFLLNQCIKIVEQ